MIETPPCTSYELRWFFEGSVEQHQALLAWFESTTPLPQATALPPPSWQGCVEERADVYLVLPGSDDMGIKWREGALEIKGRLATLGTEEFSGRHRGSIERWIKWSYPELPASYANLFAGEAATGLVSVALSKRRAQRKIRLDKDGSNPTEVDPASFIDQGIALELTEIEVNGSAFSSLAFEAYPDAPELLGPFRQTVTLFLDDISDLELTAKQSLSYPAWLHSLNQR